MSKKLKLIQDFLKIPSDFTWEQLIGVLNHYGYNEVSTGKTGGSRRRFTNSSGNLVLLHKPHPSNIVKKYILRQILEVLIERGQIEDD